jgi:hypothetical protein
MTLFMDDGSGGYPEAALPLDIVRYIIPAVPFLEERPPD